MSYCLQDLKILKASLKTNIKAVYITLSYITSIEALFIKVLKVAGSSDLSFFLCNCGMCLLPQLMVFHHSLNKHCLDPVSWIASSQCTVGKVVVEILSACNPLYTYVLGFIIILYDLIILPKEKGCEEDLSNERNGLLHRGHTYIHIHIHTDRHSDSMTESAQWADSVKTLK